MGGRGRERVGGRGREEREGEGRREGEREQAVELEIHIIGGNLRFATSVDICVAVPIHKLIE